MDKPGNSPYFCLSNDAFQPSGWQEDGLLRLEAIKDSTDHRRTYTMMEDTIHFEKNCGKTGITITR